MAFIDFLTTFNRTDQEDPLKVFRFQVEISAFARFGFAKCAGLNSDTESVEYRESGNTATPQKSPGLTKFGDITLERGQIIAAGVGDADMITWYNQVFDIASKKGSPGQFRRNIDIVQFNKEGTEVKRWRLLECWPKGHTPISDMDAMQSANSIEKLVIVHEGYRLTSSARV